MTEPMTQIEVQLLDPQPGQPRARLIAALAARCCPRLEMRLLPEQQRDWAEETEGRILLRVGDDAPAASRPADALLLEHWGLEPIETSAQRSRLAEQLQLKLPDLEARAALLLDADLPEALRPALTRRTIRHFLPGPLPEGDVQLLLRVWQQTASSTGLQHTSLIRVEDPGQRARLAAICRQGYVEHAPLLLLAVADCRRNSRISRQLGAPLAAEGDMDRFFQAWTDSCLALQSLFTAAQALGYGVVPLGSVLNDASAVIEAFELPPLTMPVLGCGIGLPAESPQLKPRLPLRTRVFVDRYDDGEDEARWAADLAAYDRAMARYYDLRDRTRRVDRFSAQVRARLEQPEPLRQQLAGVMRAQGFHIEPDEIRRATEDER